LLLVGMVVVGDIKLTAQAANLIEPLPAFVVWIGLLVWATRAPRLEAAR